MSETFDDIWKEAVCDAVKSMSSAEFDELIRQREAASRPAPRAESLPPAPRAESLPLTPTDARASITAKRDTARRNGRTAL